MSQASPGEIIRIEHLTYVYPDGRKAIDDINFHVSQGDKVALVGPNGAGKSTLLLHLNGILRGKGMIQIAGIEINDRTIKQVRSRVGIIFQNPDDQLFSPTVFDDVAYGPIYQGFPESSVRVKVNQALEQVNLPGFEDRVSYHLSLGEKKRIAIASVLSMQPDILVLDEPTAGLDPAGRRRIIQLLKDLPQTMLVASHDLPLVESLCSRTILINRGKLVADSTTVRYFGKQRTPFGKWYVTQIFVFLHLI